MDSWNIIKSHVLLPHPAPCKIKKYERDMQLDKILWANNSLSRTKWPYAETRNYYKNSTRINIKHFPDKTVYKTWLDFLQLWLKGLKH